MQQARVVYNLPKEGLRMLHKVTLSDVASYTSAQSLNDLNIINFLYGENGTGKSTLAKSIANYITSGCKDDSGRCTAEFSMKDNTNSAFLFNAEYIANTISMTALKGVFVLGNNAPELEKRLTEIDAEIARLEKNVANYEKHSKFPHQKTPQ